MLTVFSPHWWVHLLVIPSCHPSLTSEHSFLAFQYDQRLSRNPPALQHNTGTSKASSLMDATATVSLVCLSSVQTAAVGLHSPCHVANLTNPLCNIYTSYHFSAREPDSSVSVKQAQGHSKSKQQWLQPKASSQHLLCISLACSQPSPVLRLPPCLGPAGFECVCVMLALRVWIYLHELWVWSSNSCIKLLFFLSSYVFLMETLA